MISSILSSPLEIRNQICILDYDIYTISKVKVSNAQEMTQFRKKFPLQKQRWEKDKLTISSQLLFIPASSNFVYI